MISRVFLHGRSQATKSGYMRRELGDAGGGRVWFYYALPEGVRQIGVHFDSIDEPS